MPLMSKQTPRPTVADLNKTSEEFQAIEPRGLFYKAALELIRLVGEGKTNLSLAESLAVLLQTWNRSFYRFRPFDSQHYDDIHRMLAQRLTTITPFRSRSIDSYCSSDDAAVESLFDAFEKVLGPVGAAKTLHLLAPTFFPLWDTAIAKAYGLNLQKKGGKATRYLEFMSITKMQVAEIGGHVTLGRNPLKAIDEFNYCKFTKKPSL